MLVINWSINKLSLLAAFLCPRYESERYQNNLLVYFDNRHAVCDDCFLSASIIVIQFPRMMMFDCSTAIVIVCLYMVSPHVLIVW